MEAFFGEALTGQYRNCKEDFEERGRKENWKGGELDKKYVCHLGTNT